ncbi:hypothetical protein [Acidisphaera sp. S103]|uniref:hypothetical protein n=1 Tax=Acidisphaera sp. S103 TaxID=1747223 RepID=UPI00131D31D2|nr:hypothetical protein [Acidisphaera sp. S103]
MTGTTLPLAEFHHPATFASRGVAVPFTTPMLAGARVRASQRDGIELVLPNPSGSDGIYILHWPGVRALCRPTVHDTMLFRRLSRVPAINPAQVREATLEVALAGHAGRGVVAAAEAALAYGRSQQLLAHFLLSTGLVAQLDSDDPPPEQPVDIERRARAALYRIAPWLGRSGLQLTFCLAAIAALFAPAGIAAGDRAARIPRLLTRLRDTLADLLQWLAADPGNDIGGLGRAIAVAIRRACDSGEAALAATRSAVTDPLAVLKQWIADAAGVRATAMRCEWLLDGWERVALLWLSANPLVSRRVALLEMAPLIPVLPREVAAWADISIHADTMRQACRVTSREDGWRTGGSAFALIERNEKLLAMST